MLTKERKKKGKMKNKEKKERRAEDPVRIAQGIIAKQLLIRSTPARSGDATMVSAEAGQSYADILKEMKAQVSTKSLEMTRPLKEKRLRVCPVLGTGQTGTLRVLQALHPLRWGEGRSDQAGIGRRSASASAR